MAARLIVALFFIGSSLTGFSAAARAADSTTLERINFGFSAAGSVASAPLWMAQDSGAFKKYGLDVKLIFLAGGLSPVAVMAVERVWGLRCFSSRSRSSGVGLSSGPGLPSGCLSS